MKQDAELFLAAMAGGPEAFGPIVDRYRDAVFGIALARLRDFHEAEDVAQQVFVEAFTGLGRLRDPARLGAWLRSITIHRSIDRIRGRREMTGMDEQADRRAGREPTPPQRVERRELRQRVLDAIARLSKAHRETTTLFYINGYSLAEVAGIQDVPVGTVKRRLHDARERLKEEMIGMVEDVLKSEAPKDDFGRRVYEILVSRYHGPRGKRLGWRETVEALREVGAGGIEGFVKAFALPHWQTRRQAARMLFASDQKGEKVVELLKAALTDTNKELRQVATGLLALDVPDDRKRGEFLPLILPLLADRSDFVRWRAAARLRAWAADVPLAAAARALADEKHPKPRRALEKLVRAIVEADGK